MVDTLPPGLPLAEKSVQAAGHIIGPAASNSTVKKVIVAVHGVGDQQSFGTLQAVVNRFCAFYHEPTAVPLGNFHTNKIPFCLDDSFPPQHFQSLAFAEVYWAKIPRQIVSEQHTLEEAKNWASTIVERLRLRWRQEDSPTICREHDFTRLKQVLKEMIQTLAVLERLSFLGERAGLFTFDLRRLLEDYLGDVQVVAEFGQERRKILDTFEETLRQVYEENKEAEIHIIAHSEGTVIAFLGLLDALQNPEAKPWIHKVRGLMTLGSPIDKHLILWPKLFPTAGFAPWPKGQPRIDWRNYYDRGDPIGFALDDARNWLVNTGLDQAFSFEKDHDYGFTRYPFPGKAHVDYWDDDAVFGHFIHHVVNQQSTASTAGAVLKPKSQTEYAPPGDIRWKKWLSYGLPYLGVLAMIFVGVYFIFKAITGYTDPKGVIYGTDGTIFAHVADLTLLVFGLTLASRIPRITHARGWWVVGAAVFAGLALLCYWFLPLETVSEQQLRATLGLPVGSLRPVVAVLVLALTMLTSAIKPNWGLAPLLLLGTAAILSFVVHHYLDVTADKAPLWPIFPAAAAFFYLWWLAALVFDLVFVWHVQIRQERALVHMDQIVGGARATAVASANTVPSPTPVLVGT